MGDLEARQRELICDTPAREKRLQRRFYSYTSPIGSKYTATANVDKGAGAALIIAFGNSFSAFQEIASDQTIYMSRPVLGTDHHLLASVDIGLAFLACALAAVIWFLEAGWAAALVLIWSGLELTRFLPMWLYDHAYSGKGFILPVFAFVLAIMSFRGSRALKRGFPPSDSTPAHGD